MINIPHKGGKRKNSLRSKEKELGRKVRCDGLERRGGLYNWLTADGCKGIYKWKEEKGTALEHSVSRMFRNRLKKEEGPEGGKTSARDRTRVQLTLKRRERQEQNDIRGILTSCDNSMTRIKSESQDSETRGKVGQHHFTNHKNSARSH